ncbi:MAG: hypothetical protein J7577_14655 [Sphingobacteriaceae bacterium]|nr:hypothetical protein [Sphingobacteriaceae bacterium]
MKDLFRSLDSTQANVFNDLEMSIQYFLAVCSPAFAYSPLPMKDRDAGYFAQSGLGTRVLHLATSKMKYCCGHLAPVEALPCSNEEAKRKSGKREESECSVQALRSK